MHSSDDPHDVLDYDTFDLIDHAARLEYQVLALTLHGRLYCPGELQEYARSRGVLLIPGIEIYLEKREVLLLGADPQDLTGLKTFQDLRRLRQKRGEEILVIAPHPFYGLGQCLGERLVREADVFDAIEFCHYYTAWWNPNGKAETVARRLGKPMIACSDTHQLQWMHDHYNLLDAKPTRQDVFAAIRAARIRNVSRPLSNREFLRKTIWHMAIHDTRKLACAAGLLKRPLKEGRSVKLQTAASV